MGIFLKRDRGGQIKIQDVSKSSKIEERVRFGDLGRYLDHSLDCPYGGTMRFFSGPGDLHLRKTIQGKAYEIQVSGSCGGKKVLIIC